MRLLSQLSRSPLIRIVSGDAVWVGIGVAASGLVLIVGTRILTSLLSPEEYGRLALSISIATASTYLFGHPLGQTATRFYLLSIYEKRYLGFQRFITAVTTKALLAVFSFGAALTLSGRWIDCLPGSWIILLTTCFSCILVLIRVAVGVEDAARKRRVRALSQVFFEVVRFLFAVGLIFLSGHAVAETTMIGFVFGGFLTILFHAVFLRRMHIDAVTDGGGELFDAEPFKRFLMPLVCSNACLWIVLMTERWILQRYANLSDVGGYTAVYQLSFVPMIFLSNFFIIVAEPLIYQVIGTGNDLKTQSKTFSANSFVAALIVLASLIVSLALFPWHAELGKWILGEAFRPYSWLFPWLVFAGGCFAASQQMLLKLNYEMRTGELAILWTIVSVVALGMYFVGTAWFQLKGLLSAVVGVHLILFVLSILKIR